MIVAPIDKFTTR